MFWEYFQFISFLKEMVLLSLFGMLLVLTGFKIKGGWGAVVALLAAAFAFLCVDQRFYLFLKFW